MKRTRNLFNMNLYTCWTYLYVFTYIHDLKPRDPEILHLLPPPLLNWLHPNAIGIPTHQMLGVDCQKWSTRITTQNNSDHLFTACSAHATSLPSHHGFPSLLLSWAAGKTREFSRFMDQICLIKKQFCKEASWNQVGRKDTMIFVIQSHHKFHVVYTIWKRHKST